LSTSQSYKTESKGVDKVEGFFFGKFILCSNNEENFIRVDKDEIRYWVRNVPQLSDEGENPDLLKDLEKELPYFMHYINNRKIKSPRKTRMWFTKDQIYTSALAKLVKGNKTYLNKEIEEILIDGFIKYEVDELKYSLNDLVEILSKNNVRVSTSKVSGVLKNYFNLESKNGSYSKFYLSIQPNSNTYFVEESKLKGRFFVFKKEVFIKE